VGGGKEVEQYSLLWFSGTGNTFLAAQLLAEKLASTGAKTEMVEMRAELDWRPLPNQTLVLCWPVYSYGPPRGVRKFLKNFANGSICVYQLLTMGGDAGGASLGVARILRGKGYQVLGSVELLMPNNFIGGRIPHADSVQALIAAARLTIEEWSESILARERETRNRSTMDMVAAQALNAGFRLALPLLPKGFRVSKSGCNRCAVCANSCPVGNIEMKQYPQWGSSCEFCLRCLHICPQSAIDYLGTMKKRPQYFAPEVSLASLKGIQFRPE